MGTTPMSTMNVTPQAENQSPAASNLPASPVTSVPEPFFQSHGNWSQMMKEAEPPPSLQPGAFLNETPSQEAPKAPEPTEAPATEAAPVAEEAHPISPEVDTDALPEADVALYTKIINDLAKQHQGVDDNILKRLADAQFQYLKVAEKNKEQAKDITGLLKKVKSVYKPVVTSLEQSLAAPQAPPVAEQRQPEETQQQPVVAPQQHPQQMADPVASLISNWRSPEDAMDAESSAWTALHEAQTPAERRAASENIANVRNALLRIQMAPIADRLQQMVDERVQQLVGSQLGDILPVMKQTADERKAHEDMEVAFTELEKAGAQEVRSLFTEEDGTIEFNGAQYPNSPFNRIIAENPEILDIRVQHNDPRVANRLTLIKRMKMALRLSAERPTASEPAQQNLSADAAKALMEAGVKQAERAQIEKTRQQMNAGPGASGSAPAPANDFFGFAGTGRITAADFYK